MTNKTLRNSLPTNQQYTMPDGVFTFWTAQYGSWANDRRIVFRVRIDTTPNERATEKDIKGYDRLVPATDWETAMWIRGHVFKDDPNCSIKIKNIP